MEELIVAALEPLLEFVSELLVEVFISWLWRTAVKTLGRRLADRMANTVALLLFGAICGAVSGWLIPDPVFHSSHFHGVSVILSPLLVGFAMWRIGRRTRERGGEAAPLENFRYGAAFAFAWALVRFAIVG